MEDIPKYLKVLMNFIDRIGFPILAFLMMFWVAYTSLDKMSKSLEKNTSVLERITTTSELFQQQVQTQHRDMMECMKRMELKSYVR